MHTLKELFTIYGCLHIWRQKWDKKIKCMWMKDKRQYRVNAQLNVSILVEIALHVSPYKIF
jgi:hypothetical protein